MNNTISILLAVHNGEQYIQKAILSVLNQTHQDFKLLICANGCTDNTIAKIGEIMSSHDLSNKIYLTTLPNANKCEALNYLLKIADTNWIAIQDADDYWYEDKLKEQVKYMPFYDVIATKCSYMDQNDNYLELNNPIPCVHDEIKHWIKVKKQNPIINCSALINKRFITAFNGWDKEYEGVEDFYLWAQIAIWTMAKFITIDNELVAHRIHSASHFNSTTQETKIEAVTDYIDANANEKQIVE